MLKLVEVQKVEEEKHLVPNLPILAKALFGKTAYLIDWRRKHVDWATSALKYSDGMVWLPWIGDLWLVEVEWKEGSNFFDQSRSFAKGKIDSEKLADELRNCFSEFEPALNKASMPMEKGYVVENLISHTLKNHVKNDYLMPHCWVILGHEGNNIEKLREDYQAELEDRFKGKQHYILSMARMFRSDLSTYIHLEQDCSKYCPVYASVHRSFLVQAIPTDKISPQAGGPHVDAVDEEIVLPPTGRGVEMLAYLRELSPGLSNKDVRLRIAVDRHNTHDFEVDWEHRGKEFMVFSKDGIHRKPSNAAKQVFSNILPKKYGNIARKMGSFVDVSKSPPITIARYKEVEHGVWQMKKQKGGAPLTKVPKTKPRHVEGYFDSMTVHKKRQIQKNILNRPRLWEVFVEKKRLTPTQFKQLSRFKPKGVAGFMRFLTANKIATRDADIFTVDDAVIPQIRKLLKKR